MKRIIYFLFSMLIINLITLNYLYPQRKKSNKFKNLKIGSIDLNKVFKIYPGKKAADEKLEEKRKKFIAEKEKRLKAIQKLKEDLENKKSTLNDKEKNNTQSNIKKKVTDLKKYIENSNKELTKIEDELIVPIVEKIKKIIRAVSMKHKYNIILDKEAYILYIDKKFDITDEVIKEIEGEKK